jgi:redox-sensitive bicupin YhaK (pirin superfamily)
VYSPLVGLDLASTGSARAELPLDPAFEYAAMTLEGAPTVDGEALAPGTLLYLGAGRSAFAIASTAASRLLLIGGEPFGEDILLWWNFVARTREEMETATRDWNEGRRFGTVQGARAAPLLAPDIGMLRLRGAP